MKKRKCTQCGAIKEEKEFFSPAWMNCYSCYSKYISECAKKIMPEYESIFDKEESIK